MVEPTDVRLATGPADYAAAAELIRRYVEWLPFDLDFQDVDAELADLGAEYGGRRGALFLAGVGGEPVGVVAVRMVGDRLAELKRMYLRPEGRGRGLGRRLAGHALAAARRLGATRILLDTDRESMAEANALYESLGFVDVERYRQNPLPCARFMGLDLADGPAGVVGVALAGGQSRRMGADKPGLEVGGRPMLAHVTAALESAGLDRVEVSGPAGLLDPAGVAGPAAGLLAAFRRWPGHDVVLVGADQPLVRADTLRRLLDLPGAAVVPVDGARQVTCAVYRDACYPVLEHLVGPQLSLQRLLDEVATTDVGGATWRSWGEDGRSWWSVDTPDDLARLRASWPRLPSS